MTRDILLGSVISLGLHAALIFGDTSSGARPKPPREEEKKSFVQLNPMPAVEDEPEPVEAADPDVKPLDVAPPMQPDRIEPARPDVFMQKVQPPPPEGVVVSKSLATVPVVRTAGDFHGLKVFDPAMLDQVPVPKYQVAPQYPFEMRRSGVAGEVVVDFIVDPSGEVQNAYALRSSQRDFEAAAVQAVSKWKFRPGRKGGRAVPTHMQVPIVFSLNQE